jgi:adenine specific DNA methylase Mod
MRKIEQQMHRALTLVQNWEKDNTKVCIILNNPKFEDRADIYLHHNHIATYLYQSKKLTVNIDTLKRYPTNTTKSRLRALGANVTTEKGVTYLDGKEV